MIKVIILYLLNISLIIVTTFGLINNNKKMSNSNNNNNNLPLDIKKAAPIRRFLPLSSDATILPPKLKKNDGTSSNTNTLFDMKYESSNLRVLQLNMLADGLSGLRKDYGAFSRLRDDNKEILWDYRSKSLLKEMIQYDPDIITIQENDHFYDYFLPELTARGYYGHFAPKPLSSCLEVSSNSDGCSIFIKKNKLHICSRETLTFALSKADIDATVNNKDEIKKSDLQIRAQNQVALITICELLSDTTTTTTTSINDNDDDDDNNDDINDDGDDANSDNKINNNSPPPIIICTTHLKATKSATGERIREGEVKQLLQAIEQIYNSLTQRNAKPVIILTGDFNALPTASSTSSSTSSSTLPIVEKSENSSSNSNSYDALTYSYIKSHPLNFRSIYNDDVPLRLKNSVVSSNIAKLGTNNLYTTWKARRKKDGSEKVVKNCIDYIFYVPSEASINSPGIGVLAVLDLYSDNEIGDRLLPSEFYPSDHLAIGADMLITWKR